MLKRGSWASRLGFYLVAIGSACGLGNMWRFPYVVGENGGGAFVLLYVFLVLILGIPLLVGELMLGKSTGKSILTAVGTLQYKGKNMFRAVGRVSVLLCLMVLSYYTVVSGWVLHFAIQFLFAGLGLHDPSHLNTLDILLKNGLLQAALASVHLLFCIVVVLKGVQEGLEKFIGWTVPVFGFLLVLLVLKSLSLPSTANALRFLLYPDFAKLTLSSLGQAVGQVLFTLSLGFGTMVTFGSYMTDEHIPTAGFRVAMIDTVISLVAGLLIFPIALQASNARLADPGLLFDVLPKFLLEMKGGLLFGFAFFVCLYLAALGASIGLLEVVVSNWVDRDKVKRSKATWTIGLVAWVLAFIPAFSGSLLQNLHVGQHGILESVDAVIINWILPIIALGMAFTITLGMRQDVKEQLFVSQNKIESMSLYTHWQRALIWLIPGIIICGLVLQLVHIFY
jgi:NSS family neurotransmitter:Na+ symporter